MSITRVRARVSMEMSSETAEGFARADLNPCAGQPNHGGSNQSPQQPGPEFRSDDEPRVLLT